MKKLFAIIVLLFICGMPIEVSAKNNSKLENVETEFKQSRKKTVHVKGYYRKNGKYVKPHMRSKPRRK